MGVDDNEKKSPDSGVLRVNEAALLMGKTIMMAG
jgi:hypothetical protein